MNKVLGALAVVALGALGASGVIYANKSLDNNKIDDSNINAYIERYMDNNSQKMLELIAKNDTFGATIKNFTMISDDELEAKINDFFDKNPSMMENYIRNNADNVAAILLETEAFKNKGQEVVEATAETSEENVEESNPNQIYQEHWDEMKNNEVSPAIGPRDAKVTVIEFFDFACGHCKALAPVMSQLIKNNPDVRFIFNPLFFISEHSPYAAKVALAAAEKGKFHEVFDGIMTLPNMNEEEINKILVDEGLNVDEIKKMIDEKRIRRGVQDIDALSQVLGINGVPMLLINGEAFYGRNVQDIQAKINSLK